MTLYYDNLRLLGYQLTRPCSITLFTIYIYIISQFTQGCDDWKGVNSKGWLVVKEREGERDRETGKKRQRQQKHTHKERERERERAVLIPGQNGFNFTHFLFAGSSQFLILYVLSRGLWLQLLNEFLLWCKEREGWDGRKNRVREEIRRTTI